MSTNAFNGTGHDETIDGSDVRIIPLQINGKEITTSTTFDVVDPSNGTVVWRSSSTTKEDVIDAVEAAQAAFPAWSKMKPSKRRDIFLRAAEVLQSRSDEVGAYMMTETGSAAPFVGFNVSTTIEMLRDIAGRIVTISGSVPVCGEEGTSAIVTKEPYGVVLGIAPWNAPYILGFRAVAYALATGNTTILKSPELSPRCFWAIGSVFKEAGLPDGCLNVLAHRTQDAAEITALLIKHPSIKKVNFTGSTAVGRIIAATAGRNLKPCLLELGGKASAIVLSDADLKKAAHSCAIGAFFHSGQVCMATERILVESSIASSFSTHLRGAIDTIFGSSTPTPVLISPAGVSKNQALISDALGKGASITIGDLHAKESSNTRMRPIVVENVTKEMDLYRTESFGPTVSIFTVESEEDAVELANDTEYGLSCAVFTEDLKAGLRIAKQIESGSIHINHMTIHDEPNLPHGGVKMSGFGRFNASQGLEEFLRTKTITWQDG
ncbi:hypothetical protein MMC13_004999 [Lambiella insularis]|nr:hypothetical protein [Lambiella insularis]